MSAATAIPIQKDVEDRGQEIRDRLDALSRSNGGTITPEIIIKDARNPKSPLHSEFDWSDKSAAQHYRILQARKVIALYWTQVRTEKLTFDAPYFVRDPRKAHWEQGYVQTASIKDDTELAYEVFHSEVARAQSYLERARSMAPILKVDLQLENIIHEVENMTSIAAEQIDSHARDEKIVKPIKTKRSA